MYYMRKGSAWEHCEAYGEEDAKIREEITENYVGTTVINVNLP